MLQCIPAERLWLAPDCGLGFLPPAILKAKISNMVAAAKLLPWTELLSTNKTETSVIKVTKIYDATVLSASQGINMHKNGLFNVQKQTKLNAPLLQLQLTFIQQDT